MLINGAGGGAGSFAVQISKTYGAEVTGVDRTCKLEMMRNIGADHVIDYTMEDFTKKGQKYDMILDLVACHSIFDYQRVLNPGGTYVMVGGSIPVLLQTLIIGSLITASGYLLHRKTGKKMGLLAHEQNKKDLNYVLKLIEEGKVKPIIDKKISLPEIPEALRQLGNGEVNGKVVINV
jgi:NADPH:quinone reductase-like Zn-dependent oxidoreductase